MTAADFVRELRGLGIRVVVREGRPVLRGRASVITVEIRTVAATMRDELRELALAAEARATALQFDEGLGDDEAEARAWGEVLGEGVFARSRTREGNKVDHG